MNSLFGIPINSVMIALLAVFGAGVALTAFFALRSPVLFRMAVRNIPRRRAQTALIVAGLMLATLLFSASISTGDTLANSIRVQLLKGTGLVDETITSSARDATGQSAALEAQVVDRVREALAGAPVDGVMGAYVLRAPVVAPASVRNEPRVQVLGLDPEALGQGFEPLEDADGQPLELTTLALGEVYLSADAAESLNAGPGDALAVYLSAQPTMLTVRAVLGSRGNGMAAMAAVARLDQVQAWAGEPGKVNRIFVSNDGGLVNGAEGTDAVEAALEPLAEELELTVDPVKRDALTTADSAGSAFTSIFILFGNFSMIAGILLIFLIFVMLAAERKRELGIARAIGAHRGHIVQLFAFEGALYSLMAAAVGSLLGVVVGAVMVGVVASALGQVGLEVHFAFRWQSIVIAYSLGMAVTYVAVVGSSVRASVLNIVRAVRDLPEPPSHPTLLRILWQGPWRTLRGGLGQLAGGHPGGLRVLTLGVARAWARLAGGLLRSGYLLALLGVFQVQAGLAGKQLGIFLLGLSMVGMGAPLVARHALRLPDRIAYTLAGALVVALWILPWEPQDLGLPELSAGIEMFVLSGVMLVVGAVWVIVYNMHFLVEPLAWLLGRGRRLAPVVRTAVAYPMANRFRTGMTLAMFSLVVFTLTVVGFIIAAFTSAFEDTRVFSGGFDVSADVSFTNPIPDMAAALAAAPGVDAGQVTVLGQVSGLPVRIVQDGTANEPRDWFVTGVDAGYAEHITYGFMLRADGYADDAAVWRALREEPGTAVVASFIVPARSEFNVQLGGESFRLEGFYRDDPSLPEVYLTITEPTGGASTRLRVIGVLDEQAVFANTVVTAHETLAAIAPVQLPFLSYQFTLADPAQAPAFADALEADFVVNGLRATDLAAAIQEQTQLNITFNRLIQGFMGLGLVVGIAALGVIASRSVVERRTQIGVLRAVGFERTMVAGSFLIESSLVALLGIVTGLALAFGLSVSIINSIGESFASVEYRVPWGTVGLVFGIAYGASMLMTLLPALQAARLYPAEALRFDE
ncbi:MAG: FtsX-like permease family protein [Chloroflexota bacterium]